MTSLGLEPGSIIGRDFRVVEHLASGAMGSVYIVEQLSTGKQRALKVMGMDLANNERARDRFVLEARIGAKIESDHVVEVVTAGIDESTGAPYLVMELLRGEELAEMLHRQGRLQLHDVAEILTQTGHALEQAHALGVVHRDIKPENLFIAESRREGVPFTVKILDFGIAKLVAERTADGTQPVGTPLFMAPEQTDRRGVITPTTDVWPLGLIAFYCLTGQLYWQGVNQGITALLREVVLEPLAPASERAAMIGVAHLLPPGFDEWFAYCVNRDPNMRYPEAGSCVRAFAALAAAAPAGMDAGAAALQMGRPARMPTGQVRTGVDVAMAHAGTAMTSAQSMMMPVEPPKKSKAAGIIAGVVAALAVAGAAAFVLTRSKDEGPAPAGSTSAVAVAPSASASGAPVAKGCPEGMIEIAAGAMFMGSTDEDLGDDVRPPHKVKVSAFCLDKTEVTVAAYSACAKSGNCLRPKSKVDFPDAKPNEVEEFTKVCNYDQADKAQHPMNCVDFAGAKQFCESEGGRLPKGGARLPTEAEWEFAARGSGQKVFPWGDEEPGPTRLNACADECLAWLDKAHLTSYGKMFDGDDGFAATAPVGHYPAGAASSGVLDMAGNVWEWTADWYGPYGSDEQSDPKGPISGGERVVRGGGFNGLRPAWAKPAYRWKTPPSTVSHGIGFRCALTL
jgi:eukaryotic-like serine/threonine-protein kinase